VEAPAWQQERLFLLDLYVALSLKNMTQVKVNDVYLFAQTREGEGIDKGFLPPNPILFP
jgi:hypothetical protein